MLTFPSQQADLGTSGTDYAWASSKKKVLKKKNHSHPPLQARRESTASFCSQISDVQVLYVRACTRKEHFHLSGIFQYLNSSGSASPGLPRPHPKFWVGPGDVSYPGSEEPGYEARSFVTHQPRPQGCTTALTIIL